MKNDGMANLFPMLNRNFSEELKKSDLLYCLIINPFFFLWNGFKLCDMRQEVSFMLSWIVTNPWKRNNLYS